MDASSEPSNKQKISVSIDLRILCALLLLVIIGMLAFWQPWRSVNSNDRTISVTGDSTVRAEPDEYQFNPSWQFKNADKQASIDAAAAKQKEVTAKLKTLGVKDSEIKASVSGYEDYLGGPRVPETSETYVYSLTMTITQPNLAAAQKIEDYLSTTSPQGAVTPYPTFSEGKRTELEAQARNTATRNARSKADQSAKNLGFKVSGVKSVDDGSGFGRGVYPMMSDGAVSVEDSKSSAGGLVVQPGENELSYSVTVVYYIR